MFVFWCFGRIILSHLFLTVCGINPRFILTLPFAALVHCCQTGRVSAKLSIPGSLVSGFCGADGVLSCPPGCGGA